MTQRSGKPAPRGGMTKRAIVTSLVFFILVLASIIYFLTSPEAHHLGAHPYPPSLSLLSPFLPTFSAQ